MDNNNNNNNGCCSAACSTCGSTANYCAGRNCVNSLQINQPEEYKYATRTVNH